MIEIKLLQKNETSAADGKIYQVDYYNLNVIISVGYRIKSQQGRQFRIWADQIINDNLIKGFSMNQKRLAQETGKLKEFYSNCSVYISTKTEHFL